MGSGAAHDGGGASMCGACSGTLKAGTRAEMMFSEDHCECCCTLSMASENEMTRPLGVPLARSALITSSSGGLVNVDGGSVGIPYPC